MSERFYCPEPLDRPELTLGGPEVHHLMHVLRIGPGATVVLFDGEGSEAEAEIVAVSRREVRLRPRSLRRTPEPTSASVMLAVAPPKGDRFRWLVEKLTELGVTRLIPLLTTRTVVDPSHGKLDKLRQTVVAACKQCERNRLMEITEPTTFLSLIDTAADSGRRLVILHPSGESLGPSQIVPNSDLTILIGPEGGFTEDEVGQAVRHGVTLASLGKTILRTETAAIAGAAIAMQSLLNASR